MKKIILSVALIAVSVINMNAQKKAAFEGTVTYDLSFEGSGLPKEALDMMKGAQMITSIKPEHRRVDMVMPMQSTSSIVDMKAKNIVTLMDIMGTKYLIRTSEADLKKEEDKTAAPVIRYVDETKEIAGYKCKKAEVVTKGADGKEETSVVYYTEEIPASEFKATIKGLKGFPLEYTIFQGGVKMTFTAKTISKEAIADSKFEIPKEGYKETTMEGLQKEMSKMGGK